MPSWHKQNSKGLGICCYSTCCSALAIVTVDKDATRLLPYSYTFAHRLYNNKNTWI